MTILLAICSLWIVDVTDWVKQEWVCIELAGTQCGEPSGRRWRWFFLKIMLYIRCYPNETTVHGYELRRRWHERGLFLRPTMPNAISYTDSYINIGLYGANFSTSQLSIIVQLRFVDLYAVNEYVMSCNLYWWKRTSVHYNYSFRRHRWFRLIKNWSWFINHVAGDDASPSVLRMILIINAIM